MVQRTFVMVKPDGVQRRLAGEIIHRLERRGLTLAGMKLMRVSRELAEAHYAVHRGKPFYDELIEFITSGPVVAMVWQGEDAISLVRTMMGTTKPADAVPGTIRGDFTCSMQMNLVHGSDAPETADAEIALWFPESELLDY